MHIEIVDASTPETRLKQWHAVEAAGAGVEHGWPLPPWSYEQVLGFARHPGGEPISRYEATLAVEDDEVIGFTHCWWIAADNSHMVDVSVHVLPERRRAGIGTALLEDRLAAVRADGRTTVTFGAPVGGAGEAFLNQAGAKPSLLERHSLLDVRSVDVALLEARVGVAEGYRLQRWNDVPPEELLPSLARAQESMDDAPKGELDIQRENWSLDMIRAIYRVSAARGYRRFVVAAVHEETNEVAGFTEIQLLPGNPLFAEQEETVVVPAHRGHKLGMSMKAEMLLWLRGAAPELETISTWNAESNEFMLAVNVALGFQPAEPWQMFQLTLG